MDAASIFLFCLMSLVIGAVLMLLIQYYAFVRYFNLPEESEEQKSIHEKYSLPDRQQALKKVNSANNLAIPGMGTSVLIVISILGITKSNDPESKYPIVGLNLIVQFLFHELKNSNTVRKWFYRKLSLELDELLAKTTTGKLFDKLTICDLDLGGHFPEIKNLRVHSAELHDTTGHIENLDILLDIQYRGNFRLSIDADMVLGKKGSLTLKVKHLSGLARLQFTRKPYTHWSLSFLGDPQLDLDIESQFQGRQMQSNVTNLILNQIRKAVRRKHTLPNYKLRYKPFFHKVDTEVDTEIIPNGKLVVKVVELSRLMASQHLTHVYCTLTLASIPWIEAKQRDDKNVTISMDLEIHKTKNQQIGIIFRQSEHIVSIEAVLPNSPAVKADLRAGDVLVSIEGKRVTTINQVAKIVKNLNKSIFFLRIERVCQGVIRNDAILEDLEYYKDIGDFDISFSKSTESVQLIGSSSKANPKGSVDRNTSSESSVCNTPSTSPSKKQVVEAVSAGDTVSDFATDEDQAEDRNKPRVDDSSVTYLPSGSGSGGISSVGKTTVKTNSETIDTSCRTEHFQQHSTIDCPVNSFIQMQDECSFELHANCRFLNLCVYGRWNGENCLLGYLNVPINSILVESSETSLGHYFKSYSLVPPTVPDMQNHPLSTQSGFNPMLCYGDVLLSFAWSGSIGTTTNGGRRRVKPTVATTDCRSDEAEKTDAATTKTHNFVRTHFHRTTQCDFCGKKIWLKDAVQCKDCFMCCHKKCVTKCQVSTVCTLDDCTQSIATQSILQQPEFKVTEAEVTDSQVFDLEEIEDTHLRTDAHRQSFSGMLVQGLKRVNSANNLAIPGMGMSVNQGSRSLPPSPQHTPRKQSLVNQSTNPFITITRKLEAIPNETTEISKEQIEGITDTIIGWSNMDDLMALAKSASKNLYVDLSPNERVEQINILLTKLRIALDMETASHAALMGPDGGISRALANESSPAHDQKSKNEIRRQSTDSKSCNNANPTISEKTKRTSRDQSDYELTRRAILISQSEERVQALSVVMLYLCSGLQHAQGCPKSMTKTSPIVEYYKSYRSNSMYVCSTILVSIRVILLFLIFFVCMGMTYHWLRSDIFMKREFCVMGKLI